MCHGIPKAIQKINALFDQPEAFDKPLRQISCLIVPQDPLLRTADKTDHRSRKGFPLPEDRLCPQIRVLFVIRHNLRPSPAPQCTVARLLFKLHRADSKHRCYLSYVAFILLTVKRPDLFFLHKEALKQTELILFPHHITSIPTNTRFTYDP